MIRYSKIVLIIGLSFLTVGYQNCGKIKAVNPNNQSNSSETTNGSNGSDRSEDNENTNGGANSGPPQAPIAYNCTGFPDKGFAGCFYNGLNSTSVAGYEEFESLNLTFDGVTPLIEGVQASEFHARFKGKFTSGAREYLFQVTADDGVIVRVDGVELISQWKDQYPTTYSAKRLMTDGVHNVEVSYYNGKGSGQLNLSITEVLPGTPAPTPTPTSTPSPSPSPTPTMSPPPPVQTAFVGNQIIYYGPNEFAAQAGSFNYEHLRLTGGQGQVGPFWLHKGTDANLKVIPVGNQNLLKMQISDGVKWQGYNYDRSELCVRTDIPDGYLNPDVTYVIDWKGWLETPLPTVNGHMTVLWNAHGQDRISGPNSMAFIGDDLVFLDNRDPSGRKSYFIMKHRDLVQRPMHFRIFWKAHDTAGYLRVEINGRVLMERKGGQTKNSGGWNYFKFGGLYDYDRRIVAPLNTTRNKYATITEFFRYGKLP